MTTQQAQTIARIQSQHEAQRFAADQAGRPTLDGKARALNLYHAMMAAKQAGELDKARALAIELKPLLSYLD